MVRIFYSSEFRKGVKRLAKKYRSLPDDLLELQKRLMDNPYDGVDLGSGVRKVRMRIGSKGKVKSGGARVITYNLSISLDDVDVTLLTIYDKSEQSNITDNEIRELLKTL